ncbi:MAG: SpoIIE family protein phosphatase [Chitinivibrionales bacterium]|nr:SpoIIE family protein phosphatase [Chitinivibrionales bacterium]MBD3396238.1 SpoIIE family protein phosphatase [Chitinivibrionales bacterium]
MPSKQRITTAKKARRKGRRGAVRGSGPAKKRIARGTSGPAARAELDSVQSDLDLCRQIQRAMIPASLPRVEGIEVASLYCPCGTLGGDLFDVVQISDDMLALFMFDVATHGVASALISAIAKVSFSNHIRQVASPRAVLERVNAEMRSNISADFYLTAFVAYFDLHNNRLTYCNAGHPYPFVYHKKSASIVPLKTSGMFVGVFEDGNYEDETIYLYTGDWFTLMTDGLYAAFSGTNEVEGRRALEEAVQTAVVPSVFLAECRTRCDKLAASGRQKDDISALLVEVLTQSRKDQIKDKLGFSKDDPVYLQFISYYEEMDGAAGVILKDMDAAAFADESIRKMKITLTELLANAIGHGNNEDHSRKVTIGHVVNRAAARIGIMDEGEGFDPQSIPDPTLPENLVKDHGRGLYIVSNYVDKMEFNEKGNRVLIQKNHRNEQ